MLTGHVLCSQHPKLGGNSAAQQQQLLHQLRHYSGRRYDPLPNHVPPHRSAGGSLQNPAHLR